MGDSFPVRAIEVYILIIVIDVLLGWIQENPARWPRRLTNALTEPALKGIRRLLRPIPPRDWDLSPIALIIGLAVLKVGLWC